MRNSCHATHIPAQQTPQKTRTRLYEENEHKTWTKNFESSPQGRPLPAHTRLTFSKKERLLKAADFALLAGQRSRAGAHLIITSISHAEGPKLGIAVSRRFGKAFERNRFKRLIREAFRQVKKELPSSFILVRPLPAAKLASLSQIQADLLSLL